MPKRTETTRSVLLYSFDAGNGTCKAVSSEAQGVIQVEPIIAPITDRRGLQASDEKPTFSLKVEDNILVFGVEDVFAHGRRTAARRLNSLERYTSADYFRLLDVLYLHAFAAHRGDSNPIAPTGLISVPVGVYNTPETIEQMRNTLVGQREIVDYEGCTLRLDIQAKRLLFIPESYGALMHYAYEPLTLKKRSDVDTTGTTLVIDVGYETTICRCSRVSNSSEIGRRASLVPGWE